VVVDAPSGACVVPGQRVLPLRGEGTWQSHLDIANWLVPVPDEIDDRLAARAYINLDRAADAQALAGGGQNIV
jgi:NADPH:quinone reductase-like Zn-dependent oxidoreductase